MKLNHEQTETLNVLYSYLLDEHERLKTRKNNTKWFYIMTAVMALIFYLDGFGKEKYETVVYIVTGVWFIPFLLLSGYFDWGNKGLVLCREVIAWRKKELKKHGLIAFLDPGTERLTISKEDENTFYDFEKLLDNKNYSFTLLQKISENFRHSDKFIEKSLDKTFNILN